MRKRKIHGESECMSGSHEALESVSKEGQLFVGRRGISSYGLVRNILEFIGREIRGISD